jgi:secretion/DNA translocation related TadE-like protein
MANDRGAGTVLALGLISAILTLFIALAAVSQVLVASSTLQASADTAALTAADSLRGFTTGFPCAEAERISQLNMAKLQECRIVGFSVHVELRSESLGIVLSAEALAGA